MGYLKDLRRNLRWLPDLILGYDPVIFWTSATYPPSIECSGAPGLILRP